MNLGAGRRDAFCHLKYVERGVRSAVAGARNDKMASPRQRVLRFLPSSRHPFCRASLIRRQVKFRSIDHHLSRHSPCTITRQIIQRVNCRSSLCINTLCQSSFSKNPSLGFLSILFQQLSLTVIFISSIQLRYELPKRDDEKKRSTRKLDTEREREKRRAIRA